MGGGAYLTGALSPNVHSLGPDLTIIVVVGQHKQINTIKRTRASLTINPKRIPIPSATAPKMRTHDILFRPLCCAAQRAYQPCPLPIGPAAQISHCVVLWCVMVCGGAASADDVADVATQLLVVARSALHESRARVRPNSYSHARARFCDFRRTRALERRRAYVVQIYEHPHWSERLARTTATAATAAAALRQHIPPSI